MNADFLAVLEFWEREKGINRDVLVAAVHEALLSAAKKAVGPARELRVVIDQKNGDIKAFAKLMVSDGSFPSMTKSRSSTLVALNRTPRSGKNWRLKSPRSALAASRPSLPSKR